MLENVLNRAGGFSGVGEVWDVGIVQEGEGSGVIFRIGGSDKEVIG